MLEGRDVKGLLFEYIRDSVNDACSLYLDADYPAQCAAEFARDKLDCSVTTDRLKGKDRDEIEKPSREEAKYDIRHNIDLTLGEFMPMEGSEVSVDFDSAGLINWAKSRFGVEIDAAELRGGGDAERRRVRDLLVRTAEAKVDATDLSGLDQFMEKFYGVHQLCDWAKNKFGFEVDPKPSSRP